MEPQACFVNLSNFSFLFNEIKNSNIETEINFRNELNG